MIPHQEKRYQLHVVAYVLEHFQHLMTDAEEVANNTIVIYEEDDEGRLSMHIGIEDELDETVANEATRALQNGPQEFRHRTAERLISEHKNEIYANACPNCGRLPATPKARVCIWCNHSWMNTATV